MPLSSASRRPDNAPRLLLVRPGIIARWLVAVIVALLVIDTGLMIVGRTVAPTFAAWPEIVRIFEFNAEASLSTWFELVLLLLCAALLLAHWVVSERRHERLGWYWLMLALLMLAQSMDEQASAHESLGWMLGAKITWRGPFYFPWVSLALISVVIVSLAMLPLMRALPRSTRWHFLLAAGCYVGGAVGFEMIGAWYMESRPAEDLRYALMTSAEEVLEMSGLVIFLWALLTYLGARLGGVPLTLQIARSPARQRASRPAPTTLTSQQPALRSRLRHNLLRSPHRRT